MTQTVSIIMTLNGTRKQSLRAIESVMAQQHPALQLIIASGHRSDQPSTLKPLQTELERKELSCQIDFIEVEDTLHGQALNRARNKALAKAQGEYISLIDSYTFYYPERIATLLPLAQQHDVAVDNIDVLDPQGSSLLFRPFELSAGPTPLNACSIVELSTPLCPLFHRRLVQQVWDECLQELAERVFTLRVFEAAKEIPLHPWPMHGHSLKAQDPLEPCQREEQQQLIRRTLSLLNETGLGFQSEQYQRLLERQLQRELNGSNVADQKLNASINWQRSQHRNALAGY